AHTDFRPLEHRHSGNGFSYAFSKGYLNKYYIFGLQRNYTSQSVWDTMAQHGERIQNTLFKDIILKSKMTYKDVLNPASNMINNTACRSELYIDSIANIGSSAMTRSAFDLKQARSYLYQLSHHAN